MSESIKQTLDWSSTWADRELNKNSTSLNLVIRKKFLSQFAKSQYFYLKICQQASRADWWQNNSWQKMTLPHVNKIRETC